MNGYIGNRYTLRLLLGIQKNTNITTMLKNDSRSWSDILPKRCGKLTNHDLTPAELLGSESFIVNRNTTNSNV